MTLFRKRKQLLPKRKLRRIPEEWWERTEKTATHPNVNKWPQFKARLILSVCLVFFSFIVYAGLVVLAAIALIVGLPLAIWAQGSRILDLWTSAKWKEPPCVR